MSLDIKSFAIGAASGGGGREPVITSKTITENGTYTPSTGVDGFSPVVVNVPTPEPDLEDITITENGTYTHAGHDGYDEVVVAVPAADLEDITITENGTYTHTGKDGYDEVVVNVPQPEPVIQSKNITANGTYAAPSGVDGFSPVVVNVPTGGGIEPDVPASHPEYPDLDVLKDSLDNTADEIYLVIDKNIDTNINNISLYANVSYEIGHITNNEWVADKTITSSDELDFTDAEDDIFLVRIFSIDRSIFRLYDNQKMIISALVNVNNTILTNFSFAACRNIRQITIVALKMSLSAGNFCNNCYKLHSIDFTGFDISNSTSLSYMFNGCYALQSITFGENWDTSSVTNMSSMFYNCYSLLSVDLSNWDTSSLTNMNSMFGFCQSLQSLDLSNWDTSSVSDMGYMFYRCQSLQSLDLSTCDTSGVTIMSDIFRDTSALKVFKAPNVLLKQNWYAANMPVLYRTGYVSFMEALEETTTTYTLTPTEAVKYKLSADDIAIATDKGYTVSI